MEMQKISMNKKIIVGAAIVILISAVGFGVAQSKSTQMSQEFTQTDQSQSSQEAPDTIQSSESSMSSTTGVKEFTVSGSSYKFEPSTIKVKKGDIVKIIFTNSGGTHDFVIDDFNVKSKTLKSGEIETVQFAADKTGTFEFYCSVGNHRAMGMKGVLTVE